MQLEATLSTANLLHTTQLSQNGMKARVDVPESQEENID